jgi:hypothetical protein
LSPTSIFVGFQEDIQNFILEAKRNLSVEGLVAPLAIKSSDNVRHNVKHKLQFDELKYVAK